MVDGLLLYFYMALGGVYESAGLQELALACFCEVREGGLRKQGVGVGMGLRMRECACVHACFYT